MGSSPMTGEIDIDQTLRSVIRRVKTLDTKLRDMQVIEASQDVEGHRINELHWAVYNLQQAVNALGFTDDEPDGYRIGDTNAVVRNPQR